MVIIMDVTSNLDISRVLYGRINNINYSISLQLLSRIVVFTLFYFFIQSGVTADLNSIFKIYMYT